MSNFITEITDADFKAKVIDKDANLGLVLVDFWAPWCGPCLQLGPYVEELAETMQNELTVYKINIQEYRESASALAVTNIPTIVLFKDGILVDRRVGSTTNVNELIDFVKKHI